MSEVKTRLPLALWRPAVRDPGLRLLLVSLAVAVAALTSVGFFADRVERALILQGAGLLGADLVVEQGDPFPDEWRLQADSLGLEQARTVTFPSVVFANEQPQLVQVKGVDAGYPLRGRLVADAPGAQLQQAPTGKEAWVEPRLRDRLGLEIGSGEVQLGESQVIAAAVLVDEPDRGASLFRMSPRLMVAFDAVEASGLLGPASRVNYRLLLAGDAEALAQMRAWIAARMPPGAEILDLNNARPELRTAIDRAQRFLGLAALCASLLAGVAILLATRRYVERALDGAAVLRTLGLPGAAVLRWHLGQLVAVTVIAAGVGGAIGLMGQQALAGLLGDWFGQPLPNPGLRPGLVGLLFGLCLAAGFAVPTLWRVAHVPPLRVLRRELSAPGLSTWIVWGLGLAMFVALIVWQVRDLRLAGAMSLSLVAAVVVLMFAGAVLLRLLAPVRRTGGVAALGVVALARYPQLTLLQLGGFGLGITLLLLLAIIRVDIVSTWQESLPDQAPNHFALNIQPEDLPALETLLEQRGVPNSGFYATTRARLVSIGDRVVATDAFSGMRAQRMATREYSLGFSADLQADNRVVAGAWWQDSARDEPGFSVETGIADTLGIEIGDVLAFDVAGQRVAAPVTSLRTVAWDSFNVNFFVVGSPALAEELPVAYLSSLYVDGDNEDLAVVMATDFPSVSVIDVRAILTQVRDIMSRGALAIEMVFLFTLLAAALVTFAAVQVSRDERAREVAVMRTLGASRQRLVRAVLAEFGILGGIGGTLAAALASISGYLIAVELFGLPGRVNPLTWFIGVGVGTGIVMLVGWLATRRLLAVPPMRVLNSG